MNPRKLTGLTPTSELRSVCPTCQGDKVIMVPVLRVVDCPEHEGVTHGGSQLAPRECPDCERDDEGRPTGRVAFGG